jgi:putative membrane protein
VLSTLVSAAPAFVHPGFAIGFFILGHVIGFLFLLLIIGLIAGGARRRMWRQCYGRGYGHGYGHPGHWAAASRSAESTLADRFANGDIDEKEYRARLEVLRANAFPPAPPKA